MPIEIVIETHQFRDLEGKFRKYSKELMQTRLAPWAMMLAEVMEMAIQDSVPSRRVAQSFTRILSFETGGAGYGGGTRIRFYIPMKEWEELGLLLLYGAVPHVIMPREKRALMWFGGGESRGAPNRPSREWYRTPHPLPIVRHPGFIGYDWVAAIEEKTVEWGLIGPGSIANKFARDAEIKLTPTGAAGAGLARRQSFFEMVGAFRKVLPSGLDPFVAADIQRRLMDTF